MENQTKIFNDGEKWLIFENFDGYTDEITRYLPLEFEVIKKMDYDPNINNYLKDENDDPNRRFNMGDCYLVKIPQISYKESTINYLVIAPHFDGFRENVLRIAAVIDETIINDQFIDMHKCKYYAMGHCSKINEKIDEKEPENELEANLAKYNNNEITKTQMLEYIFHSYNQYKLFCPIIIGNDYPLKYNCAFSSIEMVYLTNYRRIQKTGTVDSYDIQQYIMNSISNEFDIVINPRFKKVFN